MKIGDLVIYVEAHQEEERGIIIGGPKQDHDVISPPSQWEVVWYDASLKGWINEAFLEVVSESR